MAATFPNTLTAPIQTLRFVALSLTLSHGREDGWLLGLRVLQGRQVVQAAFLFFRRPEINGCKSKLLFKPPATVKPAATYSLPSGGGSGRGHLPKLQQSFPTQYHPNTSLAACCPLSNSLPRERGRVAVGIKGSARKIGCAGCFFAFQTTCNQQLQTQVAFQTA